MKKRELGFANINFIRIFAPEIFIYKPYTMKTLTQLAMAAALALPTLVSAQGLQIQKQSLPNPDNEPLPVHPVPHPRQLMWQETEFYAFYHYSMNTYTDKEWGFGNENEKLFKPTAAPNPRQWVQTAKAAGMKGGIAVVKHHDGFCLWPTETTTHNVSNSGNEFGQKTNIPKDFAEASKELGMKYGFYVSPWDRNSKWFGKPEYVKNVFLKQCAELAKYGDDQFEMWFDGAAGDDGHYGGEAPRNRTVDRSTYYDVPNLRDTIHKIQPNCVMWGVGGEARWIGNEEGWAGETNWSPENRDYAPEKNGMYGAENGWFWFPGESDAKGTNRGWFWHAGESPLSPERLFQMYLETVGRNSTLILNLPPDRSGSLPDATVKSAIGMGDLIRARLTNNLAKQATITASEVRKAGINRNYEVGNLVDDKKETYWATNDDTHTATLTLEWKDTQTVRYVELMEYIAKGQRVKNFKLEISEDGKTWKPTGLGVKQTTIGYKRIIPLNGSTSSSYGNGFKAKWLRITIEDSKACPLLSHIAVY